MPDFFSTRNRYGFVLKQYFLMQKATKIEKDSKLFVNTVSVFFSIFRKRPKWRPVLLVIFSRHAFVLV